MEQITELGIDIAKNVFELCGLNSARAVVYRKRARRRVFMTTVLQAGAQRIDMEACGSSHHGARRLQREKQSVGVSGFRRGIPDMLEDADHGLTDRLRGLIAELYDQFHALEARMPRYDPDIRALASIDFCRRAIDVGGIGAQTATAFYAALGLGRRP